MKHYRRNVYRWCRDYGIQVREITYLDVRACFVVDAAITPFRMIVVPPLDTQAAYTAAMHEIGHVAVRLDHYVRGRAYLVDDLQKEKDAWKWAERHAKYALDLGLKTAALLSHEEGATGKRSKVPLTRPKG